MKSVFKRWPSIIRNIFLAGIIAFFAACDKTDVVVEKPLPEDLKPYFSPPEEFAGEYGEYRSPLIFESGEEVQNRSDWEKRRQEILDRWHGLLGEWPEVLDNPTVNYIESGQREDFMQHRVEFEVAPGWMRDAYILIPEGDGPMPAAVVPFYDAETGVGLERELRDFAYQLSKRGFVTLSFGSDPRSNYYPEEDNATLQPLSFMAYMAANAYQVLANLDEVDPDRIGIVGHSYGGKWAMFASALYDKFAIGVWSDGGIVFDESRSNVNFWDPWYLGYEPGDIERDWRGIPEEENPRIGAYKIMIEEGWDLHELHALMAPRPFLVSAGSEDPPKRWIPLNHAIDVNLLLGYENRVAMQNRPTHGPDEYSNEVIYRFFEHFLK